MNPLILTSLALMLLAWPTQAQAPGKLTARDIHVHPFAQEHKETKFKSNSNDLPHDLTVTTTDKIHFYGKKRTKGAPTILGKPTGHIGQLVLLPPGDRKGTISLKKILGTLRFFAVLELPDDALDAKDIPLKEGKNYTWSVQTENGNTTLRILADDGSQVASTNAPNDKVRGFGFAVTARNEGNEVDMTITYN